MSHSKSNKIFGVSIYEHSVENFGNFSTLGYLRLMKRVFFQKLKKNVPKSIIKKKQGMTISTEQYYNFSTLVLVWKHLTPTLQSILFKWKMGAGSAPSDDVIWDQFSEQHQH